jgi:hypothetical protein
MGQESQHRLPFISFVRFAKGAEKQRGGSIFCFFTSTSLLEKLRQEESYESTKELVP